jgi:hypothetical protein
MKTKAPKVKKPKKVKKEELSIQDQIWGQYNPSPRKNVVMYVTKGLPAEDPNGEKEFGLGEPQTTFKYKGDMRYMACDVSAHSVVKTVERDMPKVGKRKKKIK